jgi:hypothetical protein
VGKQCRDDDDNAGDGKTQQQQGLLLMGSTQWINSSPAAPNRQTNSASRTSDGCRIKKGAPKSA